MPELAESPRGLRLRPRLVPEPLWRLSANRRLKRSQWQRIREDALEAAANACSVCGVVRDKGMVGDEEWSYESGLALLADIRIVCPDCSAVTHISEADRAGFRAVALAHMCRINGISRAEAESVISVEFELWRERSSVTWTVTVAPNLLDRYPALSALVGLTATPGEGRNRLLAATEADKQGLAAEAAGHRPASHRGGARAAGRNPGPPPPATHAQSQEVRTTVRRDVGDSRGLSSDCRRCVIVPSHKPISLRHASAIS
jgi:hypothetical protein